MNTNNGWKLVPVEPTAEMWAAVNKLDDQMAAGGYDGKGASIEQVWNCLVETAPEALPLTVAVDPDPRGVSVGVYLGSSCIYNGAHAVPSAQDDAKDGGARWYVIDKTGQATLCADEQDARVTADESSDLYPGLNPHVAVQLAPVRAPAAGDAKALEDLQRLIEYAQTSDDSQYGTLSTGLVCDLTAKAIEALSVPQRQEDARAALQHLADYEGAIESLTLGDKTRYRVWWPAVGEIQTEWFDSPLAAIAASQQGGE